MGKPFSLTTLIFHTLLAHQKRPAKKCWNQFVDQELVYFGKWLGELYWSYRLFEIKAALFPFTQLYRVSGFSWRIVILKGKDNCLKIKWVVKSPQYIFTIAPWNGYIIKTLKNLQDLLMVTYSWHLLKRVEDIFPGCGWRQKKTSCLQSYSPLIWTVFILPRASILLSLNKYLGAEECRSGCFWSGSFKETAYADNI